MVSTLKEAHKYDMEIRRETRWFAVRKDGFMYELVHDWTIEQLDRELIDKAVKETK